MLVNHAIHASLFCLHLFSVLLLFCFHVVSGRWRWATTSFDSSVTVSSSSNHIFQTRWSSRYPTSFVSVIQLALHKLHLSLRLHVCERVMVIRTQFYFGWVYNFSVVHPNEGNRLRPSTPCATVAIALGRFFFDCVACYPFSRGFFIDCSVFRC